MELNEQLQEAYENGELEELKALIEQSADTHAVSENALWWAAESGHLEVIEYLVGIGADIHSRNDYALYVAAKGGHLETVEFLIKLGANINARDGYALYEAFDNPEVIEYLEQQLKEEPKGRVTLIEGDLLNSGEIAIGHGCNCFNTMDKGIAKAIKKLYPEAYKADLETEKGARHKLGNYSTAITVSGERIFNLYTQYTYWDINDMFYKEALEESLHKALMSYPIPAIAIPAIGIGLANGSMEDLIFTCLKVSKKTGKEIRIYFLI